MDAIYITPAIFLLTGAIIWTLGYLIKFKRRVGHIAGYAPEKVRDKDGLADWVGLLIIVMGSIAIVIGLLMFVMPPYILELALFFAVSVIGLTVLAVSGTRRYTI